MPKRDDPIDALFKLPLTDFVGARKELAARLKKSGDAEAAERAKALAKPPVSAWTVNQLYWSHREAFDELIATGQRLRKAQTSGKMANMREALDARRDALTELSDLATEVLTDAGHNPSLDTLRRITTTLEALSAFASSSDGPTPGRLTQDVDPPGFDSFGSFTPGTITTSRPAKPSRAVPNKTAAAGKIRSEAISAAEARRREQTRQAKINSAKTSLQHARKSLAAARVTVKSLEAAQKRAAAGAKEAEHQKRQAEDRFKQARAISEEAAKRAQSVAVELTEAIEAMEEAERAVEKTTRELEIAFQEAPDIARKRKSN